MEEKEKKMGAEVVREVMDLELRRQTTRQKHRACVMKKNTSCVLLQLPLPPLWSSELRLLQPATTRTVPPKRRRLARLCCKSTNTRSCTGLGLHSNRSSPRPTKPTAVVPACPPLLQPNRMPAAVVVVVAWQRDES